MVGTHFTTVAMAWQIYELTDSPLGIGLLGLARAGPQILFGMIGGVLADSMDRRRLMMAMQLAQLGVSLCLALLTLSDAISPGLLFVAAVLLAVGSATENPPRLAIVPSLVPASDLQSAVALSSTVRSAAGIAGPSVAGLILVLSGPALCYAVDAASWVIMLAALALIRVPRFEATVRKFSLDTLFAGASFVLRQKTLRSFAALGFSSSFFGSSLVALYPVYARDILRAGPVGLGLMYSAPALGLVLTASVISMRKKIEPAGTWVIFGEALNASAIVIFAVSREFILSLFMLLLTGVGVCLSSVLRGTIYQRLTPDHLRGRVSAIDRVLSIGGGQLGQFRAGAFANFLGTPVSAGLGGICVLLASVIVAFVPGARHFRLEDTEEVADRDQATVSRT